MLNMIKCLDFGTKRPVMEGRSGDDQTNSDCHNDDGCQLFRPSSDVPNYFGRLLSLPINECRAMFRLWWDISIWVRCAGLDRCNGWLGPIPSSSILYPASTSSIVLQKQEEKICICRLCMVRGSSMMVLGGGDLLSGIVFDSGRSGCYEGIIDGGTFLLGTTSEKEQRRYSDRV